MHMICQIDSIIHINCSPDPYDTTIRTHAIEYKITTAIQLKTQNQTID